jgi:hypothetical protein
MMPNFFVVGAARSSTTSLHLYLSQHSEIFIPRRKEMHFFASDYFPCTGPGDEDMNRLVIRDEEQFTHLYDKATGMKAIGETSAFYLCLPGTAERIAQAVPDAKIIMILREPVTRAYSAYMHLVREGREKLGFAEGLSREAERKRQGYEPMWWYKELSLYSSQVQHYLDVFGRDRVKVLLYEEFYADLEQGLRDIFAFLGVKEDVPIDTSTRFNSAGEVRQRRLYAFLTDFIRNPNAFEKAIKSLIPRNLRLVWGAKAVNMLVHAAPINPQIKTELKAFFTEDVAKLEQLLQRDLLCWHYQVPGFAQTLSKN